MAQKKITNDEIETARNVINGAGKDPLTIGRIPFAELMGIGENEARRILKAIRVGTVKFSAVAKEAAPKMEALLPEVEHTLKTDNKILRKKIEELLANHVKDERYEAFVGQISERNVIVPEWVTRKQKKSAAHGVALALLSDIHFDEVVFPGQIGGVNGYNREIASARTKRFFQNVIRLATDYISGVKFEGIVLAMIGDMFSGNIHDELRETNEGTLNESLLTLLPLLIAGVNLLADHFGKVFVPCVVGNHPRGTKKPRHKDRVRDNFDWLLYRLLEQYFVDDERVTFLVSEAADCPFNIYGTRFLMTHGDQFNGGSGIAGIFSPMLIGDARKRKRAVAVNKPYDILLMGHWHQLRNMGTVIINGSVKGYDEYASDGNFDFEPPRQAFFVVDPDHGLSLSAQVFCVGDDEYWMAEKEKMANPFSLN